MLRGVPAELKVSDMPEQFVRNRGWKNANTVWIRDVSAC